MTTSIYNEGNFYVYLITDLNPIGPARYYIGSCTRKELVEKNIDPELDTYYGSSSVPDLYKRQKTQSIELERVIVEVFDDKNDCLLAEEWYQRQHQVCNNSLFYNKTYANNKFSGFSTSESSLKAITTQINDIDENGLNGLERRASLRLKTMSKINENGMTGLQLSVIAYKNTVNSPEWKDTKGKERDRNISESLLRIHDDGLSSAEIGGLKTSKTKNDPKWKETKGKESTRKQKKTMSSANESGLSGYDVLSQKTLERHTDSEWKENVFSKGIKKMADTKNDPEWKETKGKEASIKIKRTVNSDEWKETVGAKKIEKYRQSVLNKRSYNVLGLKGFGEFKTVHEFIKAVGCFSESFVYKLIRTNFQQIITTRTTYVIHILNENDVGKTWEEYGMYVR
jgi:hypothetical protein